MSESLHPQLANVLREYAHDLAEVVPSSTLDARIGQLVAARRDIAQKQFRGRPLPAWKSAVWKWAAAAGLAVLAIAVGVVLGMRVERATAPALAAEAARDPAWPPAEYAMWPTDSVTLQVPAEFSADGTLVAVDAHDGGSGVRYWVDIVVSNDGTARIQRIIPAATHGKSSRGDSNGVATQSP